MEVAISEIDMNLGSTGERFLSSVPTTGFPPKPITRHAGKGNAGQWIVAYQAEQRRRLKATLISASTHRFESHVGGRRGQPAVPKNTPASRSARYRKVLDKELLLKHGYVFHPTDLCAINISGLELETCSEQYFSEFINLASICASDNRLPLEAFEAFPALEDLELSLNNITNIYISPDTMTTLTRLDLSYNNLSSGAITTLGMLPELKELYLTGNSIALLPMEMSQLQRVENIIDNEKHVQISYPKLEKLWLDDNHLSDTGTFAILAGLRKLKYLNLDKNQLCSIPRLRLLGTDSLKLNSATEDSQASDDGDSERAATPSLAPFPLLHTLSLANNMVMSAENLIACSVWPALRVLIIAGNPVVNLNKGIPPLLQQELVEREDISIVRTKSNQTNAKKQWIGKKAKDFIKVSLAPPPTIPKKPILLALESPPVPSLTAGTRGYPDEDIDDYGFNEFESFSSNQSSLNSSFGSSSRDREKESTTTASSVKGPGIFMTQPQTEEQEDLPIHVPANQTTPPKTQPAEEVKSKVSPTLTVRQEFQMRRDEERQRFRDVSRKYRGFESLLETADDAKYYDGPPLPGDAHSCARALKHALRNPLLLTDAKRSAHLTSPDDETVDATQYLRKTPVQDQYDNTPAISKKQELIQAVLEDIKKHEVTMESNLADMMNVRYRTGSSSAASRTAAEKKKREGEKLLKELQEKFERVCQTSLETIASLEAVQNISKQIASKEHQ